MTKRRRSAPRTSADDEIVELIRGAGAAMQTQLLIWDCKRARVSRLLPMRLEPTLALALRLPADAKPYGSTRELFTQIWELISRTTRLPNEIVAQISFFVFATWFADYLPQAPLMWIVAQPTTSTDSLAQVLGLLCRHSLRVHELTLGGLRALPALLKPTILTEASHATGALIRTIRASNRRCAYTIAGEKVLDLSCAKIIFGDQPLRDPASLGFPLEIALAPTREYLPMMDSADAERIAAEFQAKLLTYRLFNLDKVTAPTLDLSELTAPTRELAQNFAACIVGDQELQSQLIPLLRPRDREIQVDRAALLEAIVLEALLAACHDGHAGSLPVTYISQMINSILAGRGTTQEISPEIVGWKLRALGLRTEFISGGRKGLAFHPEIRATIHRLAAAYGVRTLQQGSVKNGCPECAALGAPWTPSTDEPSKSAGASP